MVDRLLATQLAAYVDKGVRDAASVLGLTTQPDEDGDAAHAAAVARQEAIAAEAVGRPEAKAGKHAPGGGALHQDPDRDADPAIRRRPSASELSDHQDSSMAPPALRGESRRSSSTPESVRSQGTVPRHGQPTSSGGLSRASARPDTASSLSRADSASTESGVFARSGRGAPRGPDGPVIVARGTGAYGGSPFGHFGPDARARGSPMEPDGRGTNPLGPIGPAAHRFSRPGPV